MYIYLLLFICSLTTAEDNRRYIFEDTPETLLPEDSWLNITQLAQKYMYPLEEHTVRTQDGYFINVHRITNCEFGEKKPAVLLMHGISESSDSWLLMGPKKALGYVLADKGYDVWMGNCRGNKHARRHTTLNDSMIKFWNFTWEEIAMFDLSAMIDYILKVTGHNSLNYVAHSQGTTIGYVLCSMRPEYNNKIKIMFSLAPVAWMAHIQSPILKMFSPAHDIPGFITTLAELNTYEIGIDFLKKITSFMCFIFPERCGKILFLMSGYETKVDSTFLSVILGHWPAGASMMQFIHYGQLVASQKFRRFDFGDEGNMITYGQSAPPDYDLSKVTVPVVLFYSPKDWLSDPHDVLTLKRRLPNVNKLYFLEDFTHIDYIYASDAANFVYSKIIKLIDSLEERLKAQGQ